MPIYFSNTVEAALRGDTIGLAVLGRFDFVEGQRRLWMGHGPITLGDEVWDGLGEFVAMSAISSSMGDAATPVTFTLSGIDDRIYALAVAGAATIRGRQATVYLQFFDDATRRPLDLPAAVWVGRMDRLTADADVSSRSVSLVCENLFSNRSKPPAGLYTSRDQRARHPNDGGLDFVNSLVMKTVKWI